MASSLCTQTGTTSSALVKETASITWVLDDFTTLRGWQLAINGSTNSSPFFSPPNNSELLFRQGIWLSSDDFMENVFIYLYSTTIDEKLDLEYEVSIVDSQNKKCYTKIFQCSYGDKFDYPICLSSFMSYPKLIDPENSFIPGNKLPLFCEVKILDRSSSVNTCGFVFNNKISQNYRFLLENAKFSDVVLVVGKKKFKAHKAILSAQSPVFAAMFDHDETKEAQEGRVEIVDIAAEVVEVLLRYIYTGEIVQMKEYAEELFVAADKYQLESLKSLCEQSLVLSLTVESVINVLWLADMHNSAQLKAICLDFIIANATQVMKPGAWKLLHQSRPELMMELFMELAVKSKLYFIL